MKLAILFTATFSAIFFADLSFGGIVDGRKSYPQDSIQYKNEMCSQNCIRKFPSESLMGDQLQCINSCVSRFIAECNNADLKVLGCYELVNYIEFDVNSANAVIARCSRSGQSYDVGDNGKLQCKNGYEMGDSFEDDETFGLENVETDSNKNNRSNKMVRLNPSQCSDSSTESLSCFMEYASANGYVNAGQLLDLVDQSFKSYSVDRKNRIKSELEAIDYMEQNNSSLIASLQEDRFLAEVDQCKKDKQKAKTCCSNAEACLTGSTNTPGFMNQFFGAATNVAMNSKMGAYDACNTMQNLSRGGSAATMALNAMCKNEVNNCSESCGSVYRVTKNIQSGLQTNTSSGDSVCETLSGITGVLSDHFDVAAYKKTCDLGAQTIASTQGMNSAICEDFEQSNWQQSTVALQQLAQSEIAARNCKKLVKGESELAAHSETPFNGNCLDPAHYYAAVCVQCRADRSLPQCAGLTGLPEASGSQNERDVSAFYQISDSIASDTGFGLTAPVDFDAENESDFGEDLEKTDAKALLGLSQGGGFGGGPGGLSGPGGSEGGMAPPPLPPKHPSGDSGLNANILNGLQSGGGYSSQNTTSQGLKSQQALVDEYDQFLKSHSKNALGFFSQWDGDPKKFPYRKYLPKNHPYSILDKNDVYSRDIHEGLGRYLASQPQQSLGKGGPVEDFNLLKSLKRVSANSPYGMAFYVISSLAALLAVFFVKEMVWNPIVIVKRDEDDEDESRTENWDDKTSV